MNKNYNQIYLKNKINTKIIGKELIIFDEIGSTNDFLKQNIDKYSEGAVVIAKSQTQGRGRLGNTWENSPNESLFMSILLKPNIKIDSLLRISLVCSLSILKALKKLNANMDIKIKWPNDILIEEKKICGILAECISKNSGHEDLILGIGINVNNKTFPNSISEKATSLFIENVHTTISDVIVLTLEQIEKDYFTYLQNKFLFFIDEYKKYCCNINKKVKIINSLSQKYGEIIDINEDGTLLFKDESGQLSTLFSSEVSVRGEFGYI